MMLHGDVTDPILGAFFEVHRELGPGFLESVYESAMIVAIRKRGLVVERQTPVVVYFSGEMVGKFYADLVVEGRVMVELKACLAMDSHQEAQLLNYLRATPLEVGLLLVFGIKASFRRLIMSNDRKPQFAQPSSNQAESNMAGFPTNSGETQRASEARGTKTPS
jgi:GxxExxY protein